MSPVQPTTASTDGQPPALPVDAAVTAGGGRRLRGELAALALFALLTAVHTWPLASAPGRWSRNDASDTVLNEWALAWVAHQAVTDPGHLFDGNIFYPERHTLAFSEHLMPQAALAAPVLWAGGSPVLAHNLVLLLGFLLTAWATSHMVRTWTGSWTAGAVAGSIAAFNAHTLTRIAHLQAQHLEFLPFALLAADRIVTQPRVRHALVMAAAFALQGLSSGYFLLFSTVSMAVAFVSRAPELAVRRQRRAWLCLALAAAVAAVVLLPFMLQYWSVRQEQGLVRGLHEIESYSAAPNDYLATGARIHWPWSSHFFVRDALFPGFAALVLAASALATVAIRDRRARMLVAVGAAAFYLSFGTHAPAYAWLYLHVPLFDAIRAPVRFGQVALFALAGLAGFGTAWWLAKLSNARGRMAAGALLLVLVNAEALRAPLGWVEYQGRPKIFNRLADQPSAIVACFPFYSQPGSVGGNAQYMLWSTANWRPMLNGYSGLMPRSFYRNAEGVKAFPLPESLQYLHEAGVTHVVVDVPRLSAPRVKLLGEAHGLRLWAADDRFQIYLLEGRQP
jgi:hypothetical protein